jgi:hypothetical protein
MEEIPLLTTDLNAAYKRAKKAELGTALPAEWIIEDVHP